MYYWYALSCVVIALDQLTKLVATARLEYARPVEVLPVLDMTLLHNTGAAWSMLADAGGWQRWLFAIIALGVSGWLAVWIASLGRNQRWLACALALVLGGAIGNLIDRVWLGYVVDFIHFHWEQRYFPAFNIADTAITVGAMMLAIDMLFLEPRRSAAQAGSSEPPAA